MTLKTFSSLMIHVVNLLWSLITIHGSQCKFSNVRQLVSISVLKFLIRVKWGKQMVMELFMDGLLTIRETTDHNNFSTSKSCSGSDPTSIYTWSVQFQHQKQKEWPYRFPLITSNWIHILCISHWFFSLRILPITEGSQFKFELNKESRHYFRQ